MNRVNGVIRTKCSSFPTPEDPAVNVSQIHIKIIPFDAKKRLFGFARILIDGWFLVRDIKIIQGEDRKFLAMPNKKLTAHCEQCGEKNHLRANFCNACGSALQPPDHDSWHKLYADIAHPVVPDMRDRLTTLVLEAYNRELARSSRPDYVCTYDVIIV